MLTLTSPLTTTRSLTVLLATLLIVTSNIVVTSTASNKRMSNNRLIAQQQPEGVRSVKKIDDRLIAATSRFSFKLYNQLLKQRTGKNVFVSPSSVILALAMTYNGAEAETRQAMARALELEGLSLDEVNRGFADLKSMLGSADPKLQLNIANSLWARKGFSLKPDFIQRTKEFYAAEVASLDFSSAAAPATINSWVKNNTGGRIEKIVDDKISDDTILFLINAIYFKGQWSTEFEKSKTREDDFQACRRESEEAPVDVAIGQVQLLQGQRFSSGQPAVRVGKNEHVRFSAR
jgi:serpin B